MRVLTRQQRNASLRRPGGAALWMLTLIGAGACGRTSDGDPIGAAQSAATGNITISGRVALTGGAALSGVTVTLGGAQSAFRTSDAAGNYSFTGLPNGSYSVRPTQSGVAFAPDVANLNSLTSSVVQRFYATPVPGGWTPTRVFGQADLTQVGVNQVVPNRVFHPTGALIDRMPAPTPSRLWVFDSGNNRILGFRTVGRCTGGPTPNAACTENSGCGSGGACTSTLNRNADLVLGQPSSSDRSACNGDSTRRLPAARSSLCLTPFPYTVSPLEGPVGGQMATDNAHNLYVVDPFNNRVLRFDDPFTKDTLPDKVWGQADYTSRECNRGFGAAAGDRLCTGDMDHLTVNFFSSGVDVTPDGSTIWVADLGNHRVLRIPTSGTSANLVLGQPNLQTVNVSCAAPYPMTALCKPNAVRFDPATNRLFVLDGEGVNARLVVFNNPSVNGQAASAVWAPPAGTTFFWARGLTLDPTTPGAIWVNDTDNSRMLQYINGVPTRVLSKGDFTTTGCVGGLQGDGALYPQVCGPHGSLGIDRDGTVYSGDLQEQHLEKFPGPIPLPNAQHIARSPDGYLLDDGSFQGNKIGPAGFDNPGHVLLTPFGMVVSDRQRLLFWTNYSTGPLNGGAASGVLGQNDAFGWQRQDINHGGDFGGMAVDGSRQLLYATIGPFIAAWSTQGGLVSAAEPAFEIESPLPVRGGGSIDFEASGIAVDPATDSAWITDGSHNRIMRVLNLSQSTRQVDTVIGQPDDATSECNRGNGRNLPVANGFCAPVQVTTDILGNLYVVDGVWESNGNQRALEFDRAALPPIPSPQVFWPSGGPSATRVYAKHSFTDVACDGDFVHQPCTPTSLSFEPGSNRMIMTVDACGQNCPTNPLEQRVFIYNTPVPAGVTAPVPSGNVPLPFNQAGSSAWDSSHRLAVLDHTWNRVMLIPSPPQ